MIIEHLYLELVSNALWRGGRTLERASKLMKVESRKIHTGIHNGQFVVPLWLSS